MLFEDWNNDGVMSPDERPLGGIEVEIAQQRAMTDGGGHATIAGIPGGSYLVRFGLPTLAPFLTSVRQTTVTMPFNGETPVPMSYDIGQNTPGVYMAFGDSVTSGDG